MPEELKHLAPGKHGKVASESEAGLSLKPAPRSGTDYTGASAMSPRPSLRSSEEARLAARQLAGASRCPRLPTWEERLLVPRARAGGRAVAAAGAGAGSAGPAVQLLLQLQPQAVVHLNALLQLPSQGPDLGHQVAQVAAQRDLVAGVPGVS